MSEIEGFSNAVSETAKFGTKALDSGDKLGSFLSRVLGYPIEEATGIVGDALKYKRWQRQERMIDEVNTYLKEKRIRITRAIPPKFAIPMIENASLEEDNDLQDIWCKLIANSLNPNFDLEIRYAFIEIIKTLTSLDAKILKLIYDSAIEYYPHGEDIYLRNHVIKGSHNVSIYRIQEEFNLPKEEIETSFDNLLRVQCLKDITLKESLENILKADFSSHQISRFSLTQLGINFVEACLKL